MPPSIRPWLNPLLTALGVAMSGLLMGLSLDRGMTADEFFSHHLAEMGDFYYWIFHQNHPPLYWTALKYWSQIDTSDRFLRLLSVPLGMVAVWSVGQIAGFWDVRARPWATWYAALFPPLLRWGSEARMYAWLMGFGGLGVVWGIQSIRLGRAPTGGLICLGLAALSHELGMVWAGVAGFLFWREGYRPRAEVLATAAMLALGISAVHVLPFVQKWWWTPGPQELGLQAQYFVGLGSAEGVHWAVVAAVGLVGIGLGAWRAPRLAVGVGLYFGVLGLISWFGPNVLLARAGTPLYLLLVPLLALGWGRWRWGPALPLLLFGVLAVGWVQRAGKPFEPIQPLLSQLRGEWKAGDRLVILSQWMHRVRIGGRYGGVRPYARWPGPNTVGDIHRLEAKIQRWQERVPEGRLHVLLSHRDSKVSRTWAQRLIPHRLSQTQIDSLGWWVVRLPPDVTDPLGEPSLRRIFSSEKILHQGRHRSHPGHQGGLGKWGKFGGVEGGERGDLALFPSRRVHRP